MVVVDLSDLFVLCEVLKQVPAERGERLRDAAVFVDLMPRISMSIPLSCTLRLCPCYYITMVLY